MSEEASVAVAETAQEPEVTATTGTPEIQTPEESKQQRTFTQEELDAVVSKRLAREQRKWEREQAAKLAEIQKPKERPVQDQFESVEDYAEALAFHKAEELVRARQAKQQEMEVIRAYEDREEQAMEKYPDFRQVVYNDSLAVSEVMADTIRASEIGPDIAYHLGTNPDVARRIYALPAHLQAKEIGKIEAKLEANPPARKTSNAPAPINPVTPKGTGGSNYDTTDPRSTKTMSTSEWIEAERQRQIKKLQQQRY